MSVIDDVDVYPSSLELPPDQPGPFAPCNMNCDASGSMWSCIDELNTGVAEFGKQVDGDTLARNRADISIIEIKSEPRLVAGPVLGRDFSPPTFSAGGSTAIGAALSMSLDLIDARRKEYRTNGVRAYTPFMFLLTDGQPTDEWRSAAALIHKMAAEGKLHFFAIGTKNADMSTLAEISPPDRKPMMLKDGCFVDLFKWISDSLADVSASQPGQAVPLRPTDGWGQVTV